MLWIYILFIFINLETITFQGLLSSPHRGQDRLQKISNSKRKHKQEAINAFALAHHHWQDIPWFHPTCRKKKKIKQLLFSISEFEERSTLLHCVLWITYNFSTFFGLATIKMVNTILIMQNLVTLNILSHSAFPFDSQTIN